MIARRRANRKTVDEFGSLMFQLRALDAQFTQGAAMNNVNSIAKQTEVTTGRDEDHASDGKTGQKRVWSEISGEDVFDDAVVNRIAARKPIVDEKPLERDQTDDGVEVTTNSTAAGEAHVWHDIGNELDNLLAALAPSDAADVPAVVDVACVPELINTMTASSVRDELDIVYAEEVVVLLPHVVYNACDGCKNGVDKNTAAEQHAACTLPRKKRIELFAESTVRGKRVVGSRQAHRTLAESS